MEVLTGVTLVLVGGLVTHVLHVLKDRSDRRRSSQVEALRSVYELMPQAYAGVLNHVLRMVGELEIVDSESSKMTADLRKLQSAAARVDDDSLRRDIESFESTIGQVAASGIASRWGPDLLKGQLPTKGLPELAESAASELRDCQRKVAQALRAAQR